MKLVKEYKTIHYNEYNHDGTLAIIDDNCVACGNEDMCFVSYKDMVYRIEYTQDHKVPQIKLTFVIYDDEELALYNEVVKYTWTYGKPYHDVMIYALDDLDDLPEDISKATDEQMGLYFDEPIGFALGVDIDEYVRENRRNEIKIKRLLESGAIDPRGHKNSSGFNFGFYAVSADEEQEYLLQRLQRGFDDTEMWNLNSVIARFVLPRLKRFKEINHGYPINMTWEQWNEILDKMIWVFEHYDYEDDIFDGVEYCKMSKEQKEDIQTRHQEGLNLFGEYMDALWW